MRLETSTRVLPLATMRRMVVSRRCCTVLELQATTAPQHDCVRVNHEEFFRPAPGSVLSSVTDHRIPRVESEPVADSMVWIASTTLSR